MSEARKVEARWLARLIRGRIDAGWLVRDRESKTARQATPGDVAFLFRAMTDLAPYEAALQAEGLDFHVVGGKAFYAQQEVQDLVNVLSVIEDPLDPVALAGALRGPFFGLSDDALFRMGGSAPFDLADGLERLVGLDGLDHRRASRANRLLAHWRGLKDRVSIAELVDRVLDESGFEAALLGEFLGDRKRANARKLVRLARRFDARGGFTLGHFVARIRDDLREPPREEQASTTDEDQKSVRLMSIHQAKGLEFPIVVVPDLNRKQDLPRKAVAFHPALGPLVRPAAVEEGPGQGDDPEGSGRSVGRMAYEAVERREEEAESIRLFYVVTTRARDALILSAGAGPDANPISAALKRLDERFDRRTGACRDGSVDGGPAGLVRVTTECPARTAAAPSRVRRPRLEEVAGVIESSPRSGPTSAARGFQVETRPRFFDLDAARGLTPRADRLDRLVRSILADPRGVSHVNLAEVARLAARRQIPLAHLDVVDEAIALLDPWLGGTFGKELANARPIERAQAWTVAWGGTVFQGRTEWLLGDANGPRQAVIVSLAGAVEPVERLRLLLASRAANRVVQGWRIRLGDGLHGEEDFSDAAIDGAMRAVGGFS